LVEKNNFFGKDDEYPRDHIIHVHNIAKLYGNNEVLNNITLGSYFLFVWNEMLEIGIMLYFLNP
jgi:hypothetical protein